MATASQLKAMRKKYGLGEFKKKGAVKVKKEARTRDPARATVRVAAGRDRSWDVDIQAAKAERTGGSQWPVPFNRDIARP